MPNGRAIPCHEKNKCLRAKKVEGQSSDRPNIYSSSQREKGKILVSFKLGNFFPPLQTQWSQLHEIQHLKCFCTTCNIIFYNFDHNNAITNLTFVFLAISIMWRGRIDRCMGTVLFIHNFSALVFVYSFTGSFSFEEALTRSL